MSRVHEHENVTKHVIYSERAVYSNLFYFMNEKKNDSSFIVIKFQINLNFFSEMLYRIKIVFSRKLFFKKLLPSVKLSVKRLQIEIKRFYTEAKCSKHLMFCN